MKRVIYFILISIFLSGCEFDKPPKGIIAKEKMILLLTDVHISDGYLTARQMNDSIKQLASNYYNSIYKKYGTDSIQYQKSLKYYGEQPAVMSDMYSKILDNVTKIEEQQQKLQDKIDKDLEEKEKVKEEKEKKEREKKEEELRKK